MGNTTITPNMDLPNPNPGIDPGPDYANNIYACFVLVDQHNHTPGYGVQVPPSGLDINADLTFQGNNATNLRSVRFVNHGSPLSLVTDVGCIYESAGDLWYNDAAGDQIQITANGSVNATSSDIQSGLNRASFIANQLVVQSNYTNNTPANVVMQSALLGNNVSNSNYLTLQAPTLSSNYSITLPTLPVTTSILSITPTGVITTFTFPTPSQTSFLTIDSSGNLHSNIPTADGLTISNLAPRSIVSSGTAALGQIIRSGSVTASTTSMVATTLATLSITTNGGPVMIRMGGFPQGGGGVQSAVYITGATGGGEGSVTFDNVTSSIAVAIHTVTSEVAAQQLNFPASGFSAFDYTVIGTPGTYSYTVSIANTTTGNTIGVANIEVMAWEMT